MDEFPANKAEQMTRVTADASLHMAQGTAETFGKEFGLCESCQNEHGVICVNHNTHQNTTLGDYAGSVHTHGCLLAMMTKDCQEHEVVAKSPMTLHKKRWYKSDKT